MTKEDFELALEKPFNIEKAKEITLEQFEIRFIRTIPAINAAIRNAASNGLTEVSIIALREGSAADVALYTRIHRYYSNAGYIVGKEYEEAATADNPLLDDESKRKRTYKIKVTWYSDRTIN